MNTIPCWSHSTERTGNSTPAGTEGAELSAVYRRPVTPPSDRRADAVPRPGAAGPGQGHPPDRPALRAFIALSPFATLATAVRRRLARRSPPRGDPGFVHVLDEHRLALPDRQGNNRVDSLRNLAVNPRAALMFFVPGVDETLRVFGTTALRGADALGIDFTEFGRPPLSVLVLAGAAGLLPVLASRSCARGCGTPPGGWSGRPSPPFWPGAPGPLPRRHLPDEATIRAGPGPGALNCRRILP